MLILHSFRFIGLAFLAPGVVSPDLPTAFAHPAGYGDMISAILALLSLLLLPSAAGVAAARQFQLLILLTVNRSAQNGRAEIWRS
jgi:hypothetical protein